MVAVEVYGLDDSADEAGAVRVLQTAKGLDDHRATQPFGLLFWHKRPFTLEFASQGGRPIYRAAQSMRVPRAHRWRLIELESCSEHSEIS
jgi:hypothetical protein